MTTRTCVLSIAERLKTWPLSIHVNMPEKKCQTMVACLFKGSIYFIIRRSEPGLGAGRLYEHRMTHFMNRRNG